MAKESDTKDEWWDARMEAMEQVLGKSEDLVGHKSRHPTMPSDFWKRNSSPKTQKKIAKLASLMGADHKALQILFSSTWDLDSEYGMWIEQDDTPADAVAYLVESGLVPGSFNITPHALLKRLAKAHAGIKKRNVANAFVTSLHDQRPDFRSILGTYACFYECDATSLIAALATKSGVAGLKNARTTFTVFPHRDAALRFLRSNSMEHDNAVAALLEFEAFRRLAVPEPSATAVTILVDSLNAIRMLPKSAQLQDLLRSIRTVRGNKQDHRHILESLAYCDVLRPRSSFLGKYHRLENCSLPDHSYKAEWMYPACWWTGKCGVNEKAVTMWFGHLL